MRRTFSIIALASLVVTGCTGGGSAPSTTNNVELALVGVDQPQLFDAQTTADPQWTSTKIVSAVVTITEIDAKVDGPGPGDNDIWVPIATTPVTLDLLKLDNTTLNNLGITTLPSGHVEALRLALDQIGPYVVRTDGVKKPLEVPDDGYVYVVGRLDLDACASGIIILDFDPRIKVEREPGRTEYELTCVSHIKTEELKGSCGSSSGPDMGGTGGTGGSGGGPGPDMMDPCANVFCPAGEICQGGQCVANPCNGVFCPAGQTCNPADGMCH